MFRILGNFVSRIWPLLLVCWVLILFGLNAAKPDWDHVVQDGEFRYLPDEVPSREGEDLFQRAFSEDLLGSSVVIVARRESNPDGLQEQDKQFLERGLKPWLQYVAAEEELLPRRFWQSYYGLEPQRDEPEPRPGAIIAQVRTFTDPTLGDLLVSDDNKAALVIVELTTEFMEYGNAPTIARIERLIDDLQHGTSPAIQAIKNWVRTISASDQPALSESVASLIGRLREEPHPNQQAVDRVANLLRKLPEASASQQQDLIMMINQAIEALRLGDSPSGPPGLVVPPGLDVAVSGSATVGRDMRQAAKESSRATETTTIFLVIVLLILIYRAPILALIPLMTVYLAVDIALAVLAVLADMGLIGLFSGIEVYVTVVLYGAGVDYCMFLMARYKEELDRGLSFQEAIAHSVQRVGPALAASAGTTMVGIGMMYFAEFGKFQQAGMAMSLSLFFVLSAALTFTPSLLRLAGRWAFWPHLRSERIPATSGWLSPTSLVARLIESGWFRGVWEKVVGTLRAKPGTVWLTTVAVMLPFVAVALLFFDHRSYGLLSELPDDDPSVVGTAAVQQHFPAGATSPVTVLLKTPYMDFREPENWDNWKLVEGLTQWLWERRKELGIADIRSVVDPLGVEAGKEFERELAQLSSTIQRITRKRGVQQAAVQHYVSDQGELAGHVTRIDIVLREDPFSRNSMRQFDRLKDALKNGLLGNKPALTKALQQAGVEDNAAHLAEQLASNSELYYIGATASIRDLKRVTGRDQIRIDLLVILGVFAILVLLLRRLAIAGYLIVSVFFSYLVALGVTFAVFWALDPAGFPGLDWKVPMFLFVILIAVGEDYNIYLITRIEEEQERHGSIEGVTVALMKTGSIISSCGIIMAGTFSSLFLPWLGQTYLPDAVWQPLFALLGLGDQYLYGLVQLGFALAFGVLLDTFVVRPILVPAYLILLHSGRFGALGRWLGAQETVAPGIPAITKESSQQATVER